MNTRCYYCLVELSAENDVTSALLRADETVHLNKYVNVMYSINIDLQIAMCCPSAILLYNARNVCNS